MSRDVEAGRSGRVLVRRAAGAGTGPLLVEFAGLPGSGKTTTARRVAEVLQAKGYRCACRPPLDTFGWNGWVHAARQAWFRLSHLPLTLAGALYVLSVRPFRPSRLGYVKHLMFLAYYHARLRASDHDIVLLDQSAIQTVWAAALTGAAGRPDRLARLLDRFYGPDTGSVAFALMELDADTAARRVAKRTRGPESPRFDGRDPRELRALFVCREEELRRVAEGAVGRTAAPSLRLSGSDDCGANATRIASFLETVLRLRAGGPQKPPRPSVGGVADHTRSGGR